MAEINKINVNGTEYDIALSPKKIVDFASPVGSYGIYSTVTNDAYRHVLYKANNEIVISKCFFKFEYDNRSGGDSTIFTVNLQGSPEGKQKQCDIIDLKGEYTFSTVGLSSSGLFDLEKTITYDEVKSVPFEIKFTSSHSFNFIFNRGYQYYFYGEMTLMEWS